MSNLESEYLEEENGQPAKPSNKTAATIAGEKKSTIESASNKRMRSANINAWTLRYNDESLESKVKSRLHLYSYVIQVVKYFIHKLINFYLSLSLLRVLSIVRPITRGHVQVQHDMLLRHLAVHRYLPSHNLVRVSKNKISML